MTKNWIAWWITTISMHVFIYLTCMDQDPMRAILMTDSLWAIATVICLWARRTDADGHDIIEGANDA